jgi:hypothetical protein
MSRRHRPESDVQADPAVARSRKTGEVPNPEHPDQHTTTGTTPSEEFVGRVTGEDPGDVGESGAERRGAAGATGTAVWAGGRRERQLKSAAAPPRCGVRGIRHEKERRS